MIFSSHYHSQNEMAAAASSSSVQESLTCVVCLCIFEDPRLLKCHHTLCTKCIQDVADRHPGGSFPCPLCCKQTALPAEGVTGFQSNFYIQPERLKRAKMGKYFCTTHPKHELDLYCADCKQPVCTKCAVTKHKQHTTEDISAEAERAISQLQKDKTRLEKALAKVENKMDATREKQQALQKEKERVKKDIRNRYDILVAAAMKSRDEALASVDDLTADRERTLASNLMGEQGDADTIRHLQRNVQAAIGRGAACELVDVAKKMKSGSGSSHSISSMTSQNRMTVPRLVLSSSEFAVRRICSFIGTVTKTNTSEPVLLGLVTDVIDCAGDVFSKAVQHITSRDK